MCVAPANAQSLIDLAVHPQDEHPAVRVAGGLDCAGDQIAGIPDIFGGDLADGVGHGAAAAGRLGDRLPDQTTLAGSTRRRSTRPRRCIRGRAEFVLS